MSDLDRVLGELARLLRRVDELPADDEERKEIETRRAELAALAAHLQVPRDQHRSPGPERR